MSPKAEVLREATHLATLMVDQIEWIDLYESPDGDVMRAATQHMKGLKQRDALKRIVEGLSNRLQMSPMLVEWLEPESVCVAAELVAKAIKALIASQNPANRWIMNHRLGIKFESLPAPWVQQETSSLDLLTGNRPSIFQANN